MVIARKVPEIFINKHNRKTHEFYFDMVNKLVGRLKLDKETKYQMYLAQRQSSTEQRFVDAVERVFNKQLVGEDFNYKCDIVKGSEYPELSVIDYALWALHRYIDKGDKRFFESIEDKFTVIYDIYDDTPTNIYDESNLFDLTKVKPFK